MQCAGERSAETHTCTRWFCRLCAPTRLVSSRATSNSTRVKPNLTSFQLTSSRQNYLLFNLQRHDKHGVQQHRQRRQHVRNTHIPLDVWQLKRESHDDSSARVSIISSRHHFRLSMNSPVMKRELELSTLRDICQASGWASVRVRVIMGNDEDALAGANHFFSIRTSHSRPTRLRF